jgi:Phage integrase family
LSPQRAIYNLVTQYAASLSIANLAPHDLRRTFAKLAHKRGSRLDQIQLSLGHSSIQTTERYLGIEQDLTSAPCDFFEVEALIVASTSVRRESAARFFGGVPTQGSAVHLSSMQVPFKNFPNPLSPLRHQEHSFGTQAPERCASPARPRNYK